MLLLSLTVLQINYQHHEWSWFATVQCQRLVITDKCYDYKSALKKARHNRNKYNLQTRVIAIKETTVTMFQQEVVETYDRQENKNEKN